MRAKRQIGGRYVAWARGAFARSGKEPARKVKAPRPDGVAITELKPREWGANARKRGT